ncbi:MAG: hypothetical protein CR986_05265 [Ignavibacteriae bacterium]|nr:MAG: hypothetical protein CR986_05265 [Ignavibacteriota bacterium]
MINAIQILEQKGTEIISVDINSTVADALQIMLKHKIGAILVKENDEIKGIWTERDLMRNVVTEGFYTKESKIKEVMTKTLISVSHTDTIYQLMDKCVGRKLRHLLIEKDGKYIGILSAGDITRAHLLKKTKDFEELSKIANLDYYENWKWNKKS